MENWKELPDFPGYSVSDQGQVRNDNTGRIMALSMNQYDLLTVGMMFCGVQYRRSVPLLVADAFVEGRTQIFDTPICLDGDPYNVKANNLAWRPRWFAVKYKRQFGVDDAGILLDHRIRNINTGEIHADSRSCAMWYGLLEWDLVQSISYRTYVWPIYQMFERL